MDAASLAKVKAAVAAKAVAPFTRRESSKDLVKEMDVMDSIRSELQAASNLNFMEGQGLLGVYICPLCFRRVEPGAKRISGLGCGHQQARMHAACYEAMPNRVCIYCREDVKKLQIPAAMVKLMMETMQRTQQDRSLQLSAHRAIALLAYQNKTYVELVEQYNGCKLVCESVIMYSDDEEVMGHALEAIISLCHGNTTGRKLLGQFDAPSMAVAALRFFADKPRMQIKALTAVAKLCSMDTANILLVEWANGCEVICNTIKARLMVKEVVMRGLLALKVLALYDLHSDSPLVEAGGHKLIGQILIAHEKDRDLVWVCMHVLASMASTPVSCELLEAAGACKEVAKFMALYAKDGNIQIQCCRGIAAMSVWSDEMRDRIGDQTCRLLVKALKTWPTSPPFLAAGFRAVECLTQPSMSGDINAAFFGEKGVAVLVLATVQHYTTPEHRELCYAGLKALNNLMLYPPTPVQLMGAGFEVVMASVGRAYRTDKELMEQHTRLRMYMRNGQGSKQKLQWGAVAGVLYKMSFGQTYARTMGGGADRAEGRGEREVSASGSASMFMRLLNRPQSARERDVSRSRGSVSMSGSPGALMQVDSGANSSDSASRGSFRSVLGLSFAAPGMLLRSHTSSKMSVSVTPVAAQEGDRATTPRKHSPNGSPKHDENKGGLLHLAMGTFGNLMSRVVGNRRTSASVSAAPSRPLPPNGPTPTVVEEPPSPSASSDPDENKTSGRLRLGAYRGAGPTDPPNGPMTADQRKEGGPVDPALEAMGLSGWDALEGLKKNPPDATPKPTPAPPDPKARPSPKASSPTPLSKGASKKAASPKQPDTNSSSKPAAGGLALAARFFGKGPSPTKVAPTPSGGSGKASPPPQKPQAPATSEPPKSGEVESSLASTGGEKPEKPAPPGPTTPKYLQKTAAYSARTANVTPTGAGQRANMSPSGNTPLADRAKQRGD